MSYPGLHWQKPIKASSARQRPKTYKVFGGIYIGVPYLWKLPYIPYMIQGLGIALWVSKLITLPIPPPCGLWGLPQSYLCPPLNGLTGVPPIISRVLIPVLSSYKVRQEAATAGRDWPPALWRFDRSWDNDLAPGLGCCTHTLAVS